MTAVRLALTELRRLTSGRLPRLAVVALILVPTLYGGLYLYANKDPYGALSRVPAALVVEDGGTTLANGERLEAGPTVGRDLADSHSFDWHRVSRQQAVRGVADDTYDFALVVPRDFSAALASSAGITPRQARLEVTTNDANNYLARTIAGTVVGEVTRSVAREVSSTAANRMLVGFSTVHDQVTGAVKGAAQLQSGLATADRGAADLAAGASSLVDGQRALVSGSAELAAGAASTSDGAGRLADGTGRLASGLDALESRTTGLPGQARALAVGAQQVADGNAEVADAGTRAAARSQELVDAISTRGGDLSAALLGRGFTQEQVDQVLAATHSLSAPVSEANATVQQTAGQLTALSEGAAEVAAGNRKLADAAGPLTGGLHQAAAGARSARDGAASLAEGTTRLERGAANLRDGQQSALDGAVRLRDGATRVEDGLGRLHTGATTLHDGLARGLKSIPDPSPSARRAIAQTIGSPVTVQNTSQATAGSYGAGLAPFFLSLALWIGAYVLFLLVKPLSTRALAAGQPGWRVAVGGWFAPAVFGLGQAVLVFVVVSYGLGIHATHPLGVVALMMLASATFVAVLHALAARLGAVGKFLGLVLLVLQLVSAGGTFPWQTLPAPLHALHHVLPMGYAVDGLRHLMYGGSLASVVVDAAVLSAYLAGALVLTTLTARRARVWTPSRVKPELVL